MQAAVAWHVAGHATFELSPGRKRVVAQRVPRAGTGDRRSFSGARGGCEKRPSRHSIRTAAIPLVPPESLVFDIVTVAVMPLWAAMMFAPGSKAAKVASSDILFLLGSLLYVVLMVQYGAVELLVPFFHAKSAGAGLGLLASLMQNGRACSIAWLHLLLVDLFQARFVYLDCVAKGLPSPLRVASLALCFMVAPIGILFHVISSAFYAKLRPHW